MSKLRDSAILAAVVDSGCEVEEVDEFRGKTRCPFHQEKTPSFILLAKEERFICFGCQASGTVEEYRERIKSRRPIEPKISELHQAALEEFKDDPEALKQIQDHYDELKRHYIAIMEDLRRSKKFGSAND